MNRNGIVFLTMALMVGAAPPIRAEDVFVAQGKDALAAALLDARSGDVLHLGPGVYSGPVTIDKPLTLVGEPGAEVRGPGKGTVISVLAGPTRIEGLTVTGSGTRLNDLDSGIALAASAHHVSIVSNQIKGNLIGIDVQGSKNAIVRGNVILGRNDLRKSELGPGIYVWNAPGLLVEGNDIRRGRDGVFITTSSHAVYRNNRFGELRFAFHSMYANNIEVKSNLSRDNDMGFAFMYSHHLTIEDNVSFDDRTHGLFLNFVNRAKIIHNEVRQGGEKCLFVYNSNKNEISGNLLEGCGIGIQFTAGSEGNAIHGNAFLQNRTQVKYVGTRWLEWSQDGRGNYWSDNIGFDIDGNGVADSPYRPNDVIDQITWSQPMSRLLLGSPAVQLIRWSQSRFPGLMPGGVTDNYPLIDRGDAGASEAMHSLEEKS